MEGREKRERESIFQGPGAYVCVCVCVCVCEKTLLLYGKRADLCGMFECSEEAMRRAYFGTGWASGYGVSQSSIFVLVIHSYVTNDSEKLSGFREQHSSSHGFCRSGIGAQLV